jgi:hypothetical protein
MTIERLLRQIGADSAAVVQESKKIACVRTATCAHRKHVGCDAEWIELYRATQGRNLGRVI